MSYLIKAGPKKNGMEAKEEKTSSMDMDFLAFFNMIHKKLRKLFAVTVLILIRWENQFIREAGITAVTIQERNHFNKAFMVSPYYRNIAEKNGKNGIYPTGIKLKVGDNYGEVYVTTDTSLVPIFFLDVVGHFTATRSPYYVNEPGMSPEEARTKLERDTLIFGLALKDFLQKIQDMGAKLKEMGLNGADWQSTPALALCKSMVNKTSLTVHNTYDAWLQHQTSKIDGYEQTQFVTTGESALQIGMQTVDVVATVHTVFAWGLTNEIIHKYVLAGHLQPYLGKIVGINNGPFTELKETLKVILNTFRFNFPQGQEKLLEFKKTAQTQLREALLRQKGLSFNFEGKTVFRATGRLVAQKLCDIIAAAGRMYLTQKKDAIFMFAVLPGSEDDTRHEILENLAAEFPENVLLFYGACPVYDQISSSSDYNIFASLFEPFGACYEGIAVPMVWAVDGPLGQVNDPFASGEALRRNKLFHNADEKATGFLVYEDLPSYVTENKELMIAKYAELNGKGLTLNDNNPVFEARVKALYAALERAVNLHKDWDSFCELTYNVLEKQAGDDGWDENFRKMKEIHGIK